MLSYVTVVVILADAHIFRHIVDFLCVYCDAQRHCSSLGLLSDAYVLTSRMKRPFCTRPNFRRHMLYQRSNFLRAAVFAEKAITGVSRKLCSCLLCDVNDVIGRECTGISLTAATIKNR